MLYFINLNFPETEGVRLMYHVAKKLNVKGKKKTYFCVVWDSLESLYGLKYRLSLLHNGYIDKAVELSLKWHFGIQSSLYCPHSDKSNEMKEHSICLQAHLCQLAHKVFTHNL